MRSAAIAMVGLMAAMSTPRGFGAGPARTRAPSPERPEQSDAQKQRALEAAEAKRERRKARNARRRS